MNHGGRRAPTPEAREPRAVQKEPVRFRGEAPHRKKIGTLRANRTGRPWDGLRS